MLLIASGISQAKSGEPPRSWIESAPRMASTEPPLTVATVAAQYSLNAMPKALGAAGDGAAYAGTGAYWGCGGCGGYAGAPAMGRKWSVHCEPSQ